MTGAQLKYDFNAAFVYKCLFGYGCCRRRSGGVIIPVGRLAILTNITAII